MVTGISQGGDRPFGVALAAGSVASVAGCLVASAFGTERARLTALAVAVALFAIAIRAALAAVVTAVIGWSLYLGFLVERAGELHWHGGVDAWRLGILLTAALVGAATWPLRDRLHRRRSLPVAAAHSRPGRARAVQGDDSHGGPCTHRADARGVRAARPGGEGGGAAVSADNVIGLVLATGLIVFLVVALLFPERF